MYNWLTVIIFLRVSGPQDCEENGVEKSYKMEQVFSDDNVRVKDETKLQFISFDNPEMSKYCLNLSSLLKYDSDNFFSGLLFSALKVAFLKSFICKLLLLLSCVIIIYVYVRRPSLSRGRSNRNFLTGFNINPWLFLNSTE